MRNYIILNNQRSDEISGLIIQELAPISKPLQRTQVETIDGRDGDIVTPLGYAAYDKKITIGLYGNFDINEIIAYFATQGTAIFSNEPDKYYNYQILDQIDYERLVRFRVATVTMHVQPFKYSATEGTLTIDASDTVSGEGSEIALDNTAEAPFNVLRYKGNIEQTTYTGKNLLQAKMPTTTVNGITCTNNGDGSYTLNGTATAGADFRINQSARTGSDNLQNYDGTYTLSCDELQNDMQLIVMQNGTWSQLLRMRNSNTPATATFTKNDCFIYVYVAQGKTLDNLRIHPMLEKSATRTAYEPYVGGTASPNPDYSQDIKVLSGDSTIAIDDGGDNSQEYVIPFGDTYLAAIGDYADEPVKVGDTWYIRHKIGKVVLNGSEAWTYNGDDGSTSQFRLPTSIGAIATGENSIDAFVSHFIGDINGSTATAPCFWLNQQGLLRLRVYQSTAHNLADFKTWLASNNPTVYYILATATDEEITDQDLIDALDEFYGQAHSYKGHTHIAATAEDGNAPAILSVEVGEDNESTVTNAGNTTSRPILTIYGQGDIGVYINDVEVLDIALGNEQYITLDSTEMDAYKDSPANLKNRLVTGDYSKLALNAGANKIRFTGNVTKYEISKYSRWL